VFAVSAVALGVWVAAAPGSVPGLVQPNSHGAELARMRMMGMKPGHGSMTPMRPAMTPKQPATAPKMQPKMKPPMKPMSR
jgi:hypothetical protein